MKVVIIIFFLVGGGGGQVEGLLKYWLFHVMEQET